MKVLNVMMNQRLQIDLGHNLRSRVKHKTCLTNQWDGWQEHFVVKTGSLATEERRSAEQTRWLGCWLGHGGAARRWWLSAEARGSVAREAGARGAARRWRLSAEARGSVAREAGARLRALLRRRGWAGARRRGRVEAGEEVAAQQCGGTG